MNDKRIAELRRLYVTKNKVVLLVTSVLIELLDEIERLQERLRVRTFESLSKDDEIERLNGLILVDGPKTLPTPPELSPPTYIVDHC